ncbi:MAG: ABC transporter permease [Bacillota bacterium]|nr:ABC transporter permease [Bacillota bacterium]
MGYLSNVTSVFKKETKSYFYSPMAYIILGLFMFISSILFYFFNLSNSIGTLVWMFNQPIFALILIMFISILTMRMYAEERKNGTEVLLFTSPSKVSSLIIGKFLAAYFVFIVMTLLTLTYPLVIMIFKGKFTIQMVGGYVGLLLFGSCLIAIGLFCSALTENQIIAAILSFIIMFFLFIVGSFATMFGGAVTEILKWVSLFYRYSDQSTGIFRLNTMVYFISITVSLLVITVLVIEKRRWSQG